MDCCALTPACAIAAKQSYHYQAYSIEDLIQLCDRCNSQYEDVRDKIYGLVSIVKDFELTVDYTKGAAELCLEIFKCLNRGSIVDNTLYLGDHKLESFFRTFQRLLGYPFWDPGAVCFPALDTGLLNSWESKETSPMSYDVTGFQYSTIWSVGPELHASETMTESSAFSQPPFQPPFCDLKIQDLVIQNLSSLTDCELHTTAAIGDIYTRVGSTYEKTNCTGSVEVPNSDGKGRPFWTSNNCHAWDSIKRDSGIRLGVLRRWH